MQMSILRFDKHAGQFCFIGNRNKNFKLKASKICSINLVDGNKTSKKRSRLSLSLPQYTYTIRKLDAHKTRQNSRPQQ